MANMISCRICGKENFFENLKCSSCNALIRERVPSINLGETTLYLLIEPKFAIQRVFLSEKKNYLSLLLFLFSLKLTFITFYLIKITDLELVTLNLPQFIILFIIVHLTIIHLISFFAKIFIQATEKIKIKYKNYLALYVYSFLYFSISLLILIPIEIMQFGLYLFSSNPSIFEINKTKSFLLLFLELIMILYSFYLFVRSNNLIINNGLKSLFITIVILVFQIILTTIIIGYIKNVV